jgi:class 3 adenylate cyclase/tetratricopeptide (TPR) repeat protein
VSSYQKLKRSIAALEAQRGILSDDVIDASIAALQKQLAELEGPEQQRKMVTVLFADIVGSTRMIRDLDPEESMEVMDGALKRMEVPIEEHGGHVTRFMGDGFMAVFGAPMAHENDAEMAVRAGLGILEVAQEQAKEIEDEWGIHDFQVRVGINTGLVALGGLTEAEDTLMGSTVNLATRIESAAQPGCLLISHDTYRHVRGVFDVEPQESMKAKGFDEPVLVYLVKRAKPRTFRVHTRGVEGVETRMVGREGELLILQDTYRDTMEGCQTQVVTVVGEAGVGKSRLLYEFDNWIDLLPEKVRFFQGRGRQETQNLPYALLRDLFSFRFQIQESASAAKVREKLETGFGEAFGFDEGGQQKAHIIGQLLGFDFSGSPHLKGVLENPQQLHDRALMYLAEYFQAITEQTPTVISLEDVHWADDSSLNLINRLARRLRKERLLIVCLARHRLFDRRPHWGEGLAYHTRLELRPLSTRQSRGLVREILKKVDQVTDALQDLVVKGAEGNPFYIEELIKMLIEDDGIVIGEERWSIVPARLAEIKVPSTLTGVLQARLESLPSNERTTLQQASVIGRIFWDDAVEYMNVESMPAGRQYEMRSTAKDLSSLRSRELIYHREESAFSDAGEYTFKHAVLREVTYESILKRVRRPYHALVAEWLIQHSEERAGEYAGLIGDQLELAGKYDQAASYLYQAGEQAAMRHANAEALGYLQRALALAEGQERYDGILARRAKVLLDLFKGQEAARDYERLLHRARQSGDRQGELEALLGLAAAYYTIALDEPTYALESLELYEQAYTLAHELGDKAGMVRALVPTVWFTDYWPEYGNQAVTNIEEAWAISQELGDEELITTCMMARAARALVSMDQAEELVKRLEAHHDLRRLMAARFPLSWRYLDSGQFDKCVESCDASIKAAAELDVPPVMHATIKALAFLGLGRYDAAWAALQEEIADQEHPFGGAFKDLGTGMYYMELMDYGQAATILEGVIEQARQVGRGWLARWGQEELLRALVRNGQLTQNLGAMDTPLRADVLGEIALCQGNLDEALRQAQKACVEAKTNRFWALHPLRGLPHAKGARIEAEEGDRKPSYLSALLLQVWILLKLDPPEEVIPLIDRGIRTAEEMGYRPLLWRLRAAKAQAIEIQGDGELAAQEYAAAAVIVRKLADSIADPQLKQSFMSNASVSLVLDRG